MVSSKMIGASSALLISSALGAVPARFFAETGGIQKEKLLDPISIPYNLADSQTSNTFSFWTSSFVTGKDDNEYLILSHTLTNAPVYRASIIDVNDPTSFKTFTVSGTTPTTKNGTMYIDFGDWGFASTGSDPLGQFNTYSTRSEVNYNLTIEMSSPLLLNGGIGEFSQYPPPNISTDAIVTEEWAMPAGLTSGHFVAPSGAEVEVDPSRSFTWYDRQWGNAAGGQAANWTWFELTIGSKPGVAGDKYSIWFYPWGTTGEVKSMCTYRSFAGQQAVLPATFTPNGPTWTSNNTNVEYYLSHTIELGNGLTFNVTSVAEDQELWSADLTQIAYEGFVTVDVTKEDGSKEKGFGLVEIKPAESA